MYSYLPKAVISLIVSLVWLIPVIGQSDSLVPLTDFSPDTTYQGASGGLYGDNHNTVPGFYRPCVQRILNTIQPLNAAGNPDDNGTIGFVSIGMSNTSMEFSRFMQVTENLDALNPHVTLVNGAQGSMDSLNWGSNDNPAPWETLDEHLSEAGVTPDQVQTIWMKTEIHSIQQIATTPQEQRTVRISEMQLIIDRLSDRFPNLKIIYLSSRSYGGFVSTGRNSSIPEPLSYETAFAVRTLITEKIAAERDLMWSHSDETADSTDSTFCQTPLLLWGPYIWASDTPRADGLVYDRADFHPDGIHPTRSGQNKIVRIMLDFFTSNPAARSWFTIRRDED